MNYAVGVPEDHVVAVVVVVAVAANDGIRNKKGLSGKKGGQ